MGVQLINIDRQTFDIYAIGIINIFLQVFGVFWIINNYSWDVFWFYLTYTLIMSNVPSIFAHRAWSHKSWTPGKYFNIFGLLIFTQQLTGSSIGYVAVHRTHHKFADVEGDPHSPHLRSWLGVQFSVFYKMQQSWVRNCVDLLRQPDHLWFAKNYWYINIVFYSCLYLLFPDYFPMIIAVKSFALIKQHAVNSLLHNTPRWMLPVNYSGYGPANSLMFSILTFGHGESWHQNHHEDPTNWKLSKRWYEIDIGSAWIRLFVYLGWATIPQRKLG